MRNNADTNNQDLLNWFKTPSFMEFTEKGYPVLEPLEEIEDEIKLLPFDRALSTKNLEEYYVHFFIQDYQFNRIWNRPAQYINILQRAKGVVMPDFSVYYDMPLPLQQYNYYRNLWFARMCQIFGMKVIPSGIWSDEKSFDFCFEGMPQDSVIMISTLGAVKNKDSREMFYEGLKKLINKKHPKELLFMSSEKVYKQIAESVELPPSRLLIYQGRWNKQE